MRKSWTTASGSLRYDPEALSRFYYFLYVQIKRTK